MNDTLISVIARHAVSSPDKAAVVFKDELVTYRQLAARIAAAGRKLTAMGVKRGDCVLCTALSKPGTLAVYFGIQYAGATAVSMDKNAAPENAFSIYEDTNAVLYLTDRPMKGYEDRCTLYSLRDFYAAVCDEADSAAAGQDVSGTGDGEAGNDRPAGGRVAADPEDIAECRQVLAC